MSYLFQDIPCYLYVIIHPLSPTWNSSSLWLPPVPRPQPLPARRTSTLESGGSPQWLVSVQVVLPCATPCRKVCHRATMVWFHKMKSHVARRKTRWNHMKSHVSDSRIRVWQNTGEGMDDLAEMHHGATSWKLLKCRAVWDGLIIPVPCNSSRTMGCFLPTQIRLGELTPCIEVQFYTQKRGCGMILKPRMILQPKPDDSETAEAPFLGCGSESDFGCGIAETWLRKRRNMVSESEFIPKRAMIYLQ